MTGREGSIFPALVLGKTRLTIPSCPALSSLGLTAPPPPTRQWKQSKDFNPLTLYFREKEMEKEVGCAGVGLLSL